MEGVCVCVYARVCVGLKLLNYSRRYLESTWRCSSAFKYMCPAEGGATERVAGAVESRDVFVFPPLEAAQSADPWGLRQ